MKKIIRFLPLYTVLSGVACGILRSRLFANPDSQGLIPSGHPASLPLTVLTVLSGLILLLAFLWADERDYRIRCKLPVEAVGSLIAAAGHIFQYFAQGRDAGLTGIFYLTAAGAFLVLSYFRFTAKKPPLWVPALLNVSFLALCFAQYRQWGAHTQLQSYLFPALSALFLVLYSLQYVYMELPERSCKKTLLWHHGALLCTLACADSFYRLTLALWLISGLLVRPYAMKLPEAVQRCIRKLEQAGFSAYAVGGCVRDAMLGRTAHDYDLCTSAKPQDICRVFEDYLLVLNGEKHGTVGVVIDEKLYEITTYRTEGEYGDNRHPDSVTFVSSLEEDLARRDFTVNAMAYHPGKGYIDPFGGEKDLFDRVLRAVGDPDKRFREDALRILRGVRFACRFRLMPEKKTERAMETLSPLLDNLARERVCSELDHILCVMDDKALVRFAPVILQVIPELKDCVGFDQRNPHHKHDIFIHTAKVLAAAEAEPALRWAALLHDVGKPQSFTRDEKGVGHFYGHAGISADMADAVLRRLKASNALREQVVFLIAHHMDDIPAERGALRKKLSKYGEDNLTKLVKLQYADRIGTGTELQKAQRLYEKTLLQLDGLLREEGCLQIRDLAVDGHDLMALGYAPGPKLGQCQKYLLEQVLSEEVPNEKDALLEKAKEFLNQ